MEPQELKEVFADFEILFYDEADHAGRATAQLLARKGADSKVAGRKLQVAKDFQPVTLLPCYLLLPVTCYLSGVPLSIPTLKIDLHIHTCVSKDGVLHPAEVIKIAKRRGLDRICITDHNTLAGALAAKR